MLTRAQQETYDWLCGYWKEYGGSPTTREIMNGLNLKSTSTVQCRLQRLREKGFVTWEEKQARTLRHLDTGFVTIALNEDTGSALLSLKQKCDAAGADFDEVLIELCERSPESA